MMVSFLAGRFAAAVLSAAVLALAGIAQDRPEVLMFVADRGTLSAGTDGTISQYTVTGGFLAQLPNFGSGRIRGIEVADNGDLFVARGGAINRYEAATGYAAGVTFALGSMAQDVAIHPATGNIWCAFGTGAATSSIVEMTPAGATVQTITDALIEHPRSIAFSYDGDDLYVANVTGLNVLHVDSAPAGVPTVSVFAAETDLGTGFLPVHVLPSRVQDDFVTVVGDYSGPTQIRTVTGVPGSVGVTTLIDYGTTTDLLSPAGGSADSSSNLFFAGRDRNMGTPGIYVMREDSGNRPIPAITGTQLINPIDIAFRRSRLDVTITSPDGVDSEGQPVIFGGSAQTKMLGIDISAPEFPNAGYAIFFSTFTNPVLQPFICIDRPLGTGIDLGPDGDPRFLPLDNTDAFTIGESLNIVVGGGVGVLNSPCPGAQAGSVQRFLGGLDAAGEANAELIFPALPCLLPPGAVPQRLIYGFTVVLLDGLTAPIGIGAMSTFPSCMVVQFGP